MFVVEMTDMSGWQQTPGEVRIPSSREIAIVSGRTCRYVGNLPCSLITHVMVGARVVWDCMSMRTEKKRLETFSWWILHDAHEVITGDVIQKSDEMKAWQKEIDSSLAVVYGIDMEAVDKDVIGCVDLQTRWLEVRYYGSAKFVETFWKFGAWEVPSSKMKQETIKVFESDFGRLSRCVVDWNEGAYVNGPVLTYGSILDAILCGDQAHAAEIYNDMVVELGFDGRKE